MRPHTKPYPHLLQFPLLLKTWKVMPSNHFHSSYMISATDWDNSETNTCTVFLYSLSRYCLICWYTTKMFSSYYIVVPWTKPYWFFARGRFPLKWHFYSLTNTHYWIMYISTEDRVKNRPIFVYYSTEDRTIFVLPFLQCSGAITRGTLCHKISLKVGHVCLCLCRQCCLFSTLHDANHMMRPAWSAPVC